MQETGGRRWPSFDFDFEFVPGIWVLLFEKPSAIELRKYLAQNTLERKQSRAGLQRQLVE